MTCVRTPDPLEQIEPGPYAADASDEHEPTGRLDRLRARLTAWIEGVSG